MKYNDKKDFVFDLLKKYWADDLTASIMVFLLALPLSLGIAKASDFPAIYGLVTAVIGGLVIGFFTGSPLSVKGPAAGLIVIAAGAVQEFGGGIEGWHGAAACVVVSGVLQIIFAKLKWGKFSDLIPGAAIHGMLAAIGIIIMSKQIHNMMGIPPIELKGKEPLELLAMIPHSLMEENDDLTEIALACLGILVLFSFNKNKYIKRIPPPIVVLAVAIPLAYRLHVDLEIEVQNLFTHQHENYALVKIGNIIDELSKSFINIDFGVIKKHPMGFIEYVVLFSLIGTIESLLTIKAIDNVDPLKRNSDSNRDLLAVGTGNIFAGIMGGLPMISEVARSSAGVQNGGKTMWVNIFHGLFLLIALLFGVKLIEMIPNSALAAMLVFVGFRLAHPKEFIHMWKVGKEQFVVFSATIVVTLVTDLLLGVMFGIMLELFIYLLKGIKLNTLFKFNSSIQQNTLTIEGTITFLQLIKLKGEVEKILIYDNPTINLSKCNLIDHTCFHYLNEIKNKIESENKKLEIIGLEKHKRFSNNSDSGALLIKS